MLVTRVVGTSELEKGLLPKVLNLPTVLLTPRQEASWSVACCTRINNGEQEKPGRPILMLAGLSILLAVLKPLRLELAGVRWVGVWAQDACMGLLKVFVWLCCQVTRPCEGQ